MPREPHDDAASPGPAAWRIASEIAVLAAAVLLFFVLIVLLVLPEPTFRGAHVGPPLIAAAGAILLWPLRHHRMVRAILLASAFLLAIWFIDQLSSILVPFAVTYLFAYLFDPIVTRAHERLSVPRWASSFVLTAALLGGFVAIVLLLVPSLVSELETLGYRLLNSVGGLQEWVMTTTVLDKLEATGVVDKGEFIASVSQAIQDQAERLTQSIPEAARQLVRSISGLLGVITLATVLPVVLFYLLKDYPFIKRRLVELFPTFGGRRDYLVRTGGIVGSYLRGQLTISAIAAFNVSVALVLLDAPFALLIGLLGGLLNMVPSLGIILANVIGVLIGVTFGDPWLTDTLIILGVLFGQSVLEQTVLTPNILSHEVGLHPALIIFSLFVFGYLLGLFGLVIAVPATALLMTVYKTFRDDLTLELRHEHAAEDPARVVLPPQDAP